MKLIMTCISRVSLEIIEKSLETLSDIASSLSEDIDDISSGYVIEVFMRWIMAIVFVGLMMASSPVLLLLALIGFCIKCKEEVHTERECQRYGIKTSTNAE